MWLIVMCDGRPQQATGNTWGTPLIAFVCTSLFRRRCYDWSAGSINKARNSARGDSRTKNSALVLRSWFQVTASAEAGLNAPNLRVGIYCSRCIGWHFPRTIYVRSTCRTLPTVDLDAATNTNTQHINRNQSP